MEMFLFLHDEGCLAVSMERSGFCLSWRENYLCMAFGVLHGDEWFLACLCMRVCMEDPF